MILIFQLKLKLRFSRLTTDEDIEAANGPSSSAAVDEYDELTEDEVSCNVVMIKVN